MSAFLFLEAQNYFCLTTLIPLFLFLEAKSNLYSDQFQAFPFKEESKFFVLNRNRNCISLRSNRINFGVSIEKKIFILSILKQAG